MTKSTSPSKPLPACGPPPVPADSLLPHLGLIFQEMTYRSQQRWGLPPNVCMVLGHLQLHPDICEPAAIAEAKSLPRQTMTFVLDTLEKRGLATRKPHPSDRRRKTVHLTAKGEKLADGIFLDFMQVEKEAVSAIGKTSLETVRNILKGFGEAVRIQNARDFKTVKG